MKAMADRQRYMRIFHDDFGFNVNQIAAHYEMSPAVVAEIVKPRIHAPVRQALAPLLPDIFASWVSGSSVNFLARTYGCSRYSLHHALEKYGSRFEPNVYHNFMKRTKRLKKEKGHG